MQIPCTLPVSPRKEFQTNKQTKQKIRGFYTSLLVWFIIIIFFLYFLPKKKESLCALVWGFFVVFSIHTISYTYYYTYNNYYYHPFLIVINVIMGSRQKCVRFFVCYFLLSFWLFRSEKTKILLTCCR